MGSITIRGVDDAIKQGARLAGVRNGRSMEAEIRSLLERTYLPPQDERTSRILAMSSREFIDHLVTVAGGAALELPECSTEPDRDVFGAS